MACAPQDFVPGRGNQMGADSVCKPQGSILVESGGRGWYGRRRNCRLSRGSISRRRRLCFFLLEMPRRVGARSFLLVRLVLLRLKVLLGLPVLGRGVRGHGLHFDGLRHTSSDSGFGVLSGLLLSAIRG